MKKTIDTLLSLLLLFSFSACSAIGQAGSSDPLKASGTIEADNVRLSPEIGGKLLEIKVDRGDNVKAGDVLFRLDDAILQAQRSQAAASLQAAQAGLAAAQANLSLLEAGATQAQLDAAQAQLDQAEANRQATEAGFYNLTYGNRPEDISAAQERLNWARQEYYSMTVVLNPQDIEDVHVVVTQADSNLNQAKSRQAQAQKDSRTPPSVFDAASAAIADAQAVLDNANLAYQVVQDAKMPFCRQIAAVRKTWQLAQLNLSQAQARQTTLRADSNMIQEALDDAQSSVDNAQTLVDKSKAAYDALNGSDQADRLNSAWTQMQNAQNDLNALGRAAGGTPNLETVLSQLDAANAQRNVAGANLANLKNGARPEQIAAAQAQVDAAQAQIAAAQAALNLIDVQLSKLTVTAPTGGVVLDKPLNVGEMAAPGATVIELGDLDQVTLTVYIPEDQYGKINLGQKATIKVDSFPGKTFEGSVEYISDQAEFTPRNVQTVESRSTTVYAVKITIPNPDHQLKSGMPADASF